MRILKFKSQLPIAFFTAVNHLNRPLRKQNFTSAGYKGSWFAICGFRPILSVSVFQVLLLVIVIMIDSSEQCNCEGSFWSLEFACLWKAQYLNCTLSIFSQYSLVIELKSCFHNPKWTSQCWSDKTYEQKAFVSVDEVLLYCRAKTIKQHNSEKIVDNRIFKRWPLKFLIDQVVYVFLCTNV